MRSPTALAALVVVLVVAAGTGGAVAGSKITGKQIKNESVTGKDVRNGSLGTEDLSTSALAQLLNTSVSGPQGPPGPTGPRGPGLVPFTFRADATTPADVTLGKVGPFTYLAECDVDPFSSILYLKVVPDAGLGTFRFVGTSFVSGSAMIEHHDSTGSIPKTLLASAASGSSQEWKDAPSLQLVYNGGVQNISAILRTSDIPANEACVAQVSVVSSQ